MAEPTSQPPAWLSPFVDYAPLAVFVLFYLLAGLYAATAALMAATVLAVGLSYLLARHVPTMPVVTAVIVLFFGGLTLLLDDDRFIKMKPTIVCALFAMVLLGGLAMGRPLLRPLLGKALSLTEAGWVALSFRYGLFFAACAVLNEIVWRSFSTDFWVTFKVGGLIALNFVFLLSQIPLITRHQVPEGRSD